MTRDNNPDRLDDGARAEAEMKERDGYELAETVHGEIVRIVKRHNPLKEPALPAPQGDDTLVGEIDRLRKALIETGRHIGAGLADTVSTDFLMLVPEEAQLKMASQAERIAALEVERDAAREYGKEARILGMKAEDKRIHEQHRASVAESLLAEAREAVKPLEWDRRNSDGTIHIATALPGEYWAWELAGFGYWSWGSLVGREVHGGLEAAKAAAQADFEARIRSALLPASAEPVADDGPITQQEMVKLFGSTMPIEAAALMANAPNDWTISQVRAELRRMASPPASGAVEAGWQTMESAPKSNGTILLGWGDYRERDGFSLAFMRWSDLVNGWSVNAMPFYPTHWRPLPAAPTEGR